jgi:hypothetical protein
VSFNSSVVPLGFFFSRQKRVLHNTAVTSTIYDARNFYFDLTVELRRLRSPPISATRMVSGFGACRQRGLGAISGGRNASRDAEYFDHQHSYEMLETEDPWQVDRIQF